jgi:hypothetical protein
VEERAFSQSRSGTKLKFRFCDEHLDYSIREAGRGVDLPIKYELITATDPYIQVGRSGHFIQFVVPTVAMTFVILAVVRASAGDNAIFLWAVLLAILAASAFLLVKYRDLTSSRSTMFGLSSPAGLRAIQVLHDRTHDEIVGELRKRWRARLRRLHLVVNPSNDPKREAAKFAWLLERGVVSEEEYDAAIREIRMVAPAPPSEETRTRVN